MRKFLTYPNIQEYGILIKKSRLNKGYGFILGFPTNILKKKMFVDERKSFFFFHPLEQMEETIVGTNYSFFIYYNRE